jgi:folate-binding protein YgfZ
MGVYIGERDVVLVRGEDATSYLQGQVSQDVAGLGVGKSAWSLILQPQGKVDAWFRITRTGQDAYVLDVDAGFGEALLSRVKRFMLRVKVDLELDTWVLHAYDTVVPEDAVVPEDTSVPHLEAPIVAPSADGRGVDIVGPDLDDSDVVADNEHQSTAEYTRRRIEGGIPAMGAELGASTIPAEAGVVNRSVSFTKGCYTGQELVARVDSRGDNTPRRLRIVSGSGQAPASGDELYADDANAGIITSVADTGDGWIALAYVRRSALKRSELALDVRSVDVRPTPWDIEAQTISGSP